jgi:hypothetical protein
LFISLALIAVASVKIRTEHQAGRDKGNNQNCDNRGHQSAQMVVYKLFRLLVWRHAQREQRRIEYFDFVSLVTTLVAA